VNKGPIRKILRWIVGIAAVLLLLVALAILFRNPLLKTITCWNIHKSTGLHTSMGGFDLDVAGSRLHITRFRIYNSAVFGGSLLVDIPEVYLEADPQEAAKGRLRFKEVRFNLAEANVVRDTNGITNIESLKKKVEATSRTSGRSHTNGFEFAGIDKLTVTLGKLNFTDLQQPENSANVELGIKDEVVRNIKTEEDLQNWAMALVLRLAIQQSLSGSMQQSKTKALETLLKQIK